MPVLNTVFTLDALIEAFFGGTVLFFVVPEEALEALRVLVSGAATESALRNVADAFAPRVFLASVFETTFSGTLFESTDGFAEA